MKYCLFLTAAMLLLPTSASKVTAEETLLSSDRPIPEVIDHYIQASLNESGLAPAARTDDSRLLRRLTLDLAGRIPTVKEQDWFTTEAEDLRLNLLVDRLMKLPDFDFHLRNELDAMLLPNKPFQKDFREYLLWAVQQNRRWDVVFRDLLLPSADETSQRGAAEFLLSRIGQVDDLTNDTAILFFGVNISCAKCHDHPLVEDWKQDHFYGMQAFFSRTYKTKKNHLSEKFYDEVKFRTTEGEEKKAAYMFLTGSVVPDRTPEYSDEDRKDLDKKISEAQKKDDADIPVPEFSPRYELVEAALKDQEDDYFACNIVNRIWARLMGIGIVDPVDQMHSGNPASHPELLRWLARDFRRHGFDLRRLIRGIVLSETYARSSDWTGQGTRPDSQQFAVGKVCPQTPRQLAASLLTVTMAPEHWPDPEDAETWSKRREEMERKAEQWVREFEQPGVNFQIAVDEALFFSNNDRIENDILRDSKDRLVGHLGSIENDDEMIDALFAVVLNRKATKPERQTSLEWLSREGDRAGNVRQLAWALMTGPEFRFNH